MKTEETKKGNGTTPSPKSKSTNRDNESGSGSKGNNYFTCPQGAEAVEALKRLMMNSEESARAHAMRKEMELRSSLHILYHDFKASLDSWRRIAEYIREDAEKAYEAVRTGGNVEGRIHDIAKWAGAIDRKTAQQRAALGLIKEIAEAATGDWLYLLDDIDD